MSQSSNGVCPQLPKSLTPETCSGSGRGGNRPVSRRTFAQDEPVVRTCRRGIAASLFREQTSGERVATVGLCVRDWRGTRCGRSS